MERCEVERLHTIGWGFIDFCIVLLPFSLRMGTAPAVL